VIFSLPSERGKNGLVVEVGFGLMDKLSGVTHGSCSLWPTFRSGGSLAGFSIYFGFFRMFVAVVGGGYEHGIVEV
jgi:hypothetical protein